MKTIKEQQDRIDNLNSLIDSINCIYDDNTSNKKAQEQAFYFTKGFAAGYVRDKNKNMIIDPIIYFALLRGGDLRDELHKGVDILRTSIHDIKQLEKEIE